MDTTTAPPHEPARFAFPVSLDVANRRCVVAGGGPLAQEKADALRAAGAAVVEVAAGEFHVDLLDDTYLLIVSGEDNIDAAAVYHEAKRRGILANFLDDIPHCDFAFPSVVQRGDLKVAISSAGKAPALSRRVRLQLEQQLHPGLGPLVDAYHQARNQLLPRQVPFDVWAHAWRAALDDVDTLLDRCAHGDSDQVGRELVDAVSEHIVQVAP